MEDEEDVGSRSRLECDICGSSDFISESGFYYCSVCNTQSQQARQYVEDEAEEVQRSGNVRRAGILRDPAEKSTAKVKGKHHFLSSWEVLNHVLKGMTDKLIQVGFPPILKDKVFQLWRAYLIRREVIFCESDDDPHNTRSAVSAREPKMNLFALYNRKYERARSRKRKNLISDILSNKARKARATITRKKAFQTDYLSNVAEKDDSAPKEKRPGPARLTKAAKKVYSCFRHGRREFLVGLKRKSEYFKRSRAARFLEHEQFTLKSVLILLFVACRQVGCRVLFTDIVRLVWDGTLYVDTIKHLMGEEEYKQYHLGCDKFLYLSLGKLKNVPRFVRNIENFLQYTGVLRFRYPTFREFLPKFIDDCNFPNEFEGLLIQMNKMFTEEHEYSDIGDQLKRYRCMIEVTILALMGMGLKMLFGLDDVTERYQSRFAKTVNDILARHLTKEAMDNSNSAEGWTQLFVIEDWFPYIRNRDALVTKEMYNPCMHVPGKLPNITKLNDIVNRYAEFSSRKYAHEETANKVRLKFEGATEKCLGNEIPEVPDYLSLPLTNESIFKQYESAQPNVSYPNRNASLMSTDFSKKRIDYIFNPDKYIPLLKKAGYRVKVIPGDAVNCKESLPYRSKTLYLFQPYKRFDDFPGTVEQTSHSMQFMINLFSKYLSPREVSGDTTCTVVRTMLRLFGNLYCCRALNAFVPLPSSRSYPDNIEPEIEFKYAVSKTRDK